MDKQLSVWTFVVIGGRYINLSLPNNPIFDHRGMKTVWKVACTEAEAIELHAIFVNFGATSSYTTEITTPGQVTERQSILDGTFVDDLQDIGV